MKRSSVHSSLKASVVEDRAYARSIIEMQQQASVCRLSMHLCFNLSSVLNYFHFDKRDLVINWELYSKRQARVETIIKSRKKINCSIGAGHSGHGVINIPPV